MTNRREADQVELPLRVPLLAGFVHRVLACVLLRSGDDEPEYPGLAERVAIYVVSITGVLTFAAMLLALWPFM
ncbi:hypothetical protein OG500_21325 [Kitasatospora sp. NBC_01250]|uniref:hypothetical protein n=1 Tax=Kitasatospora sp. NBC_01250 TaxID=2903571 RepID=UPI002E2EB47A|nr:hypothetical protein [Kitasatospora sp. NBC_01250]